MNRFADLLARNGDLLSATIFFEVIGICGEDEVHDTTGEGNDDRAGLSGGGGPLDLDQCPQYSGIIFEQLIRIFCLSLLG